MSALKQVFVRVHFRYERDPYAPDLEDYAAWLLQKGYSNKTARTHLYRVQQVLHAIKAPPRSSLDEALLRHAFKRLTRRRWRACLTASAYIEYARATGRLVTHAPEIDPLGTVLLAFCERLERVRGFAHSTVDGYRHWVQDYLKGALQRGGSLQDLSLSSLSEYIQRRTGELRRTTLLTAVQCIR